MAKREVFTTDEVAVTRKTLDQMEGTSLGVETTGDDCVSTIVLNVQYLADDGSELSKARVRLSDGEFRDPIKETYERAVAIHGGNPGDDNYPKRPSIEDAWVEVKDKLEDLIADVDVTTRKVMAEEMVAFMSDIGPDGQKWGRKMLLDAYR